MKTIEIVGYRRTHCTKTSAKEARNKGHVVCVLYGGDKPWHFEAPMYLFRDLIYTPEARFVLLNIEGMERRSILQASQYHPVSEVILHADFLEIFDDKPIQMRIPIHFSGTPVGVQKGGKLITKMRHLKVSALPKDMPEQVEIQIQDLDFGKTARISDVEKGSFTILQPANLPIAMVNVPKIAKEGK